MAYVARLGAHVEFGNCMQTASDGKVTHTQYCGVGTHVSALGASAAVGVHNSSYVAEERVTVNDGQKTTVNECGSATGQLKVNILVADRHANAFGPSRMTSTTVLTTTEHADGSALAVRLDAEATNTLRAAQSASQASAQSQQALNRASHYHQQGVADISTLVYTGVMEIDLASTAMTTTDQLGACGCVDGKQETQTFIHGQHITSLQREDSTYQTCDGKLVTVQQGTQWMRDYSDPVHKKTRFSAVSVNPVMQLVKVLDSDKLVRQTLTESKQVVASYVAPVVDTVNEGARFAAGLYTPVADAVSRGVAAGGEFCAPAVSAVSAAVQAGGEFCAPAVTAASAAVQAGADYCAPATQYATACAKAVYDNTAPEVGKICKSIDEAGTYVCKTVDETVQTVAHATADAVAMIDDYTDGALSAAKATVEDAARVTATRAADAADKLYWQEHTEEILDRCDPATRAQQSVDKQILRLTPQ
jgi:hypothetical protein